MLGGESGDIHMWEADTLREIARHKAHSGWHIDFSCMAFHILFTHSIGTVTCLHLSKDGSVLVSGSKDKCIGIWHTVTGPQSLR